MEVHHSSLKVRKGLSLLPKPAPLGIKPGVAGPPMQSRQLTCHADPFLWRHDNLHPQRLESLLHPGIPVNPLQHVNGLQKLAVATLTEHSSTVQLDTPRIQAEVPFPRKSQCTKLRRGALNAANTVEGDTTVNRFFRGSDNDADWPQSLRFNLNR